MVEKGEVIVNIYEGYGQNLANPGEPVVLRYDDQHLTPKIYKSLSTFSQHSVAGRIARSLGQQPPDPKEDGAVKIRVTVAVEILDEE